MAFTSFNSGSHAQPMNEINTTPLVDVMLVLLVIFLITAPLLNQAIPVDLPRAESSFSVENLQTIQLSIDEKGIVFVNGDITTMDQLETTLRGKITPDMKSPDIHLRADRHTEYERVAQMMAAANKAGITKISFVTESPLAPQSSSSSP